MHFPPLKSPLKFYTVVPTIEWVERTVRARADTVQLRCETLRGSELKREIEHYVATCRGGRPRLFINDHQREAVTAGAYGVHLEQEDMDTTDSAAIAAVGLWLELNTHSLEEMDRALVLHLSYVTSDVVFPTATKDMPAAPQGLEQLRGQIVRASGTPMVATGGVTLDNAADVLATGIAPLTVMSAVTKAKNPEAAVKSFQALWK